MQQNDHRHAHRRWQSLCFVLIQVGDKVRKKLQWILLWCLRDNWLSSIQTYTNIHEVSTLAEWNYMGAFGWVWLGEKVAYLLRLCVYVLIFGCDNYCVLLCYAGEDITLFESIANARTWPYEYESVMLQNICYFYRICCPFWCCSVQ